ncbi:hypothetical protein [Streptomyces sp. NBC_01180]|uniref:hypothetical protein n=1 Tax=Streptomyces sp. NBC_01180 TaxID=2903763 RepID=UPI00386AB808|nr:hypothetical protein OG708_17645 [Streptomyces sp. NBC_01180]
MDRIPAATRDRLAALLRQGASNHAAARELGIDRTTAAAHRRKLGIGPATPPPRQTPLTVEERWAKYTRPVEGGHVEWTGRRTTSSQTPVMTHQGKAVTARPVAFRMRTGRDPVGYVTAECDYPGCVAPGCVDDEPGRTRTRQQLAAVMGRTSHITECVRGHDTATHRRYLPNGSAYCGTCAAENKLTAQAAA